MEKRFELGLGRDVRLAAGAGAFAAYMSVVLFWVLQQPGGDGAARLVGLMHLLPALVAAVICGRLAMQRTSSWQGRMGWAALGLGSLAFAVAQGADTYDRIFARVPNAFPAFFDLFYLASYPCLFVGFLGLALERGWSSRPRVLLDRLISLSPFLALSWYFVLKPL